MRVATFFTWDYSLNSWLDSKTIERELKFFKHLEETKNISFSFFTYGNDKDTKIAQEYRIKSIYPIFERKRFFKNRFIRLILSLFIPTTFKKEIKDCDVIFQNQLLGCWVPVIAKYLYKKPLIIRTGYNMLDFAKKDAKSKLIIIFYNMCTIIALRFSDLFTVTSKSDLNFFSSTYPKYKHKVIYRPNWVDLHQNISLKNRSKNKILSVGRLENQKNYTYLIKEFKNTNDWLQIDIVGSGSEAKELRDLAKKQNVHVNFLGNLKNDELFKIYKEYMFYVSTSLFEGNPKTVLEAMSSGCVVLLSNIPNHEELVENNLSGILFDLNENELKIKFKKISEDPSLINKISKNAVDRIQKNNSLETSTNLFLSDFEKLV